MCSDMEAVVTSRVVEVMSNDMTVEVMCSSKGEEETLQVVGVMYSSTGVEETLQVVGVRCSDMVVVETF